MRELAWLAAVTVCGCAIDGVPSPEDAAVVLAADASASVDSGAPADRGSDTPDRAQSLLDASCIDDVGTAEQLFAEPDPLPFDAPKILTGTPQGINPTVLALADLTGDGLADFVLPNSLRVLPSLRGGGFGKWIVSKPSRVIQLGVLADLDGDGVLDAIGLGRDLWDPPGYVVAHRGRGDGTFAAWGVTQLAFSKANHLAAADLDGDKRADLLWLSAAPVGALAIVLSVGDGTVRPAAAPPDLLGDLATGDFDGDRKIDVVATSDSGIVVLMRGVGNGTLAAASTWGNPAPAPGAFPLAAGDLDGNGTLDVVAAVTAGSIEILLGRGDGTFGAPRSVPAPLAASAIRIGDFDGDRVADLLLVDGAGGELAYLRGLGGQGGPAFGAPALRVAGDQPSAPALGDVDGDGRADTVVVGTHGVALLPGSPDGAPRTTHDERTGPGPRALALADLDGDGALDVLIAAAGPASTSTTPARPGLYFHHGRGDGSFAAGVDLAAGRTTSAVFAIDLDRDAQLDAAALTSEGLLVARGRGDGSFTAPAITPIDEGGPSGVMGSGDFDDDGAADFVIAGNPMLHSFALARGGGDGTFQVSSHPVALSPIRSLAVGDFDGDRNLDVVLAGALFQGTDGALLGDGHGGFTAPQGIPQSTGLMVHTRRGACGGRDGLLFIRISNHAALESTCRTCQGDWPSDFRDDHFYLGVRDFADLDLNGDGFRDLVAAQSPERVGRTETFGVGVLLAGYDGAYVTSYPTGAAPTAIATGDVDGDGRVDLVVAAGLANAFTVLRNLKP